MQRVMIIGQPGSGKSTLARQVGTRLGLPVVHIDHIHWQEGWVERSRDDKTRMCLEAEAGAAWVFEGGHSVTWDNRMARADMVIWLDRPVALRLCVAAKTGAASVGSKPGTCSRATLRPWRFSIRRQCAWLPALTKLTARPDSPARPVRPMRCT